MPALIFNIYLNQFDKLEIFKNTFKDIQHLFEEKHMKIKGKYAKEAKDFVLKLSKNNYFYQDITNKDWIKAFSMMVENVNSRSVFIYNEDHKLIENISNLATTLKEFEEYKLDYLCYSWFYSSNLYANNLLPLSPEYLDQLAFFDLNKENFKKLKDNSGKNFYPFSVVSIVSTKLLKYHLRNYNQIKIHNKYIVIILYKLFGYPGYRYLINKINLFLMFFNLKLFICPIRTPGDLEVHKSENYPFFDNEKVRFGVLKNQLFTALDDDNFHYGESLLKMGKFPFNVFLDERDVNNVTYSDKLVIKLETNQIYPLQYIPYLERHYDFPVLSIKLISGKAQILIDNKITNLEVQKEKVIFSSHKSDIRALDDALINIKIGSYINI